MENPPRLPFFLHIHLPSKMTSPNKRKDKKPASEEKKKARSVSKSSEQERGEGYKNPLLAGTKHGDSGGGGISIPSAAGGILVGGPAGGSSSIEQPSEGARPRRRRAEVVAPAGVDPNCRVCGREFGSWKALFGHMRSHPERQWRGAFPPPVEQRHAQEEQAGAGERGAEEGRVAREFDLNYRPADAGTSSSPEKGGGGADWDLNALPPAAASGDDEKRGAA